MQFIFAPLLTQVGHKNGKDRNILADPKMSGIRLNTGGIKDVAYGGMAVTIQPSALLVKGYLKMSDAPLNGCLVETRPATGYKAKPTTRLVVNLDHVFNNLGKVALGFHIIEN